MPSKNAINKAAINEMVAPEIVASVRSLFLMHVCANYAVIGGKNAADGALHNVRWDLAIKVNTLELLEHPHCALNSMSMGVLQSTGYVG